MTIAPADALGGQKTSGGSAYSLRGVERTYRSGSLSVQALKPLDIDIATGEMVALEGPSGSGKSTLLLLLGALDTPTSGKITFFDKELGGQGDRTLTTIRRDDIGFVFQQFNLIPTLSADENVAIAMVPTKTSRADRIARARDLLGQVGLGHRLDHLPSRLSGGEQQRVAIARALANSPRVLIADEPTGNLDSKTAEEVIGLIRQLHEQSGVTVVLATHDEEIARRAERRIRLRDGSVVEDVRHS